MTRKTLTLRVKDFLTLQNIAIIVAIATTVLTVAGKWYYMTFEIEDLRKDVDFLFKMMENI